jgi:excinuclease ABC subunit B
LISSLRRAAADLEFETAARLRDEIKRLESVDLGLHPSEAGRSLQAAAPKGAPPQKSAANYKMRARINAPIQPPGGRPRGGGRRRRGP